MEPGRKLRLRLVQVTGPGQRCGEVELGANEAGLKV